jgi:hypothetical protein
MHLSSLQPELSGSIVLPRLVDRNVLPEGRHRAVPGLVSDRPVAGAPQVSVGDNTSTSTVTLSPPSSSSGPASPATSTSTTTNAGAPKPTTSALSVMN